MSGGGGGSSGTVAYPTYMEEVHEDWLRMTDDTIEISMTEVMDAALGASPFTTLTAYDPTTEVAAILAAPGGLETLVDLLSTGTPLDTLIEHVLDESRITDSVAAFSADLAALADAGIYPRFEAGMRDINSVMTSAFPIGRALIGAQLTREVAKFETGLRYKAWGEDSLRVIMLKLEYEKAVATLGLEANRLSIVANKEEVDANAKLDEADATWDLEVFQYGANLLAGISGGTSASQKGPTTAQSVIGGALSGLATGAAIGAFTAAEGAVGLAALGGPAFLLGGLVIGAAAALLG